MDNFNQTNLDESRRNLQIWRCESCQVVHFKTDNVLLGFTRAEFADLTQIVMKIYEQEFGSSEFCDLIGMLKQRDDVLISQSVS